jgi:rhodanese-related sulfurtransferase
MGAKRMSTIGYEKLYNKALLIKDKQQFIASLTTNMPPAPDHFSRCSATNGKGPALTGSLPAMEELAPAAFKKESAKTGTIVLDIRGYDAFGGQHVPGAYHIDLAGNFATFAGWMLPADARILLVANSPQDAKEAAVWLRRVGLDNVAGYLSGGMSNWAKEGLPTAHVDQLSVHELRDMAEKGSKMVLVDVRAPAEYEHGHIEGAVNIPAPALRARFKELDANTPVTLICSTGNRSSMASSILKQHGFKKVSNVSGGMTGYAAAGFAPACAMCVAPHVPLFMGT